MAIFLRCKNRKKFFGLNKKTPHDIAIERHAKRTVEQAGSIQQRWNEARIAGIRSYIREGYLPKEVAESLSELATKDLDAFNDRIKFLQQRATRHAARTPAQRESIQQRWEEKLKRDAKTRKDADRVLALASTWNEVDYTALESIIAKSNLTAMPDETQKLMDALKAMRAQEKALADLIPDAHEWHKKFSMAELRTVHDNVARTLKSKGWSWDINDAAGLDNLRRGLKHEVDWMGTKGRRYTTWEVSQSAYKEKLAWAEKRIEMLGQKTAIEDEIKIIRASRSTVGKQLVTDFDKMFMDDTTDISKLRAKAADIKAKAEQLEKARAKRAATASPTSSAIPFSGMTDAEAKQAIIDYAKKIGAKINPADIVADHGFIHLQGDQHLQLYNALRPETPAEHRQLWTHSGGGGAHFGKGGYVRTGNSFQLNTAFRSNGIFGKIDASNEALLRRAGMTDDDLRTIRLLDKKIAEFSMPIPLLATRYVGLPALESIFGTRITAMGSGSTVASLNAWAKAIKSLPRKDMAIDPAFLSASTNEVQNVFIASTRLNCR